MNLRRSIVAMSALAVASDAVLIAFYPQFFEQRYGVTSSLAVGAYIGAISLAVMCTFPAWARLERRFDTLRLVIWTQAAAGLLCTASYWAPNAIVYCAMSLPMFMVKSSYLLLFPYLMRQQDPGSHPATVGLLSVVVHLGGIFGTVAGGALLQGFGPAACLWLMAAGDFCQMAITQRLLRRRGPPPRASRSEDAAATRSLRPGPAILRLCALMLVFDFSVHLASPFFSLLWERVSGIHNEWVAGGVYAIPGVVALLAMELSRRAPARLERGFSHLQGKLLLGALGLALQAWPNEAVMLCGRVAFGWALFQAIVKLEVGVFRLSQPERYAIDYSLANFFQNLGVLLSSVAAGAIVSRWNPQSTFVVGAVGLLLAALLDRLFVRLDRLEDPAKPALESVGGAHAG